MRGHRIEWMSRTYGISHFVKYLCLRTSYIEGPHHCFLRKDQDFVWGPDLKAGLRDLDDHYRGYPEDVRNKGIMTLRLTHQEGEIT